MWSDSPKKVGIGAGSQRYPTSLIIPCYGSPDEEQQDWLSGQRWMQMEQQRELQCRNPKIVQSQQAATMREAQECCTSVGWHREVCNGARCMKCCSSSEVREGALVSSRQSFSIRVCFQPNKEVSWEFYFLFLELLEQQNLREVLHAEQSKGSGSGSSCMPFLLRGSVENGKKKC